MRPSDLMPKKIVDPNSETVKDIQKNTGMGRGAVQGFVNNMVENGKFERVWKKIGNKFIPAYRVKKKG